MREREGGSLLFEKRERRALVSEMFTRLNCPASPLKSVS